MKSNKLNSIKLIIKRFIINPISINSYIKSIYFYKKGTNQLYDSKKIKDKFLSKNKTLDYLIKNRISFVRYGDGDINVMMGMSNLGGRSIQKSKPKLVRRLKKILDNKKLLIGFFEYLLIPKDIELKKINNYTYNSIRYRLFLSRYVKKINLIGDANIFRNGEFNKKKLKKFLSINDVVIITKENKNVKNIKLSSNQHYIWIDKYNAYSKYEQIIIEINNIIKNKKLKKEKTIFLLAAGSTAKLLVEDITIKGYLAWDVGAIFEDLYIGNLK
jgi:hypothetical protein